MSGAKQIRTQIASIKNTQKITKAMEMVAASKMRKAKERMSATRPYASKIKSVINHLAAAHSEYKHPFMVARPQVKRVGIIIVTSDRGLCGGLNANLFKATLRKIGELQAQNVEIDLSVIGSKGMAFFRRISGVNVVSHVSHLGDRVQVSELIGSIKVMLDNYNNGIIDELYLAENEFINSMTQAPSVTPVLPLPAEVSEERSHHWDYIYEPTAEEVLDALLVRYIESMVYSAVVENVACEMSARMIAMKSASDNAGSLIDDLQLAYNKARQASITQELSEIVGGAAAV
jgi:F-type H+-transporting ATPase subunit gamma|tara:strand:+ start:58898 stop:59764 length:867 start_codon:yes stop_codon:yes gene_type:complete